MESIPAQRAVSLTEDVWFFMVMWQFLGLGAQGEIGLRGGHPAAPVPGLCFPNTHPGQGSEDWVHHNPQFCGHLGYWFGG